MTEEDKLLVERLRWRVSPSEILLVDPPRPAPDRDCHYAADRIEAQAAEIERLKNSVRFPTSEEQAVAMFTVSERWLRDNAPHRFTARAAEIERLRETGTKLAGYAGHDDNCEIMLKGVWGDNTPCDCGYEDAWKAWAELGETK